MGGLHWYICGQDGTHFHQSVNVQATCTKIVYDKHLHGRNLAMMGASPMDCVCKLCGGADSQHHIIRECTHNDMLECRTKHVQLLKRRSSDMTARSIPIAPYFKVYLDFALQAGEDSRALTAWTGIFLYKVVQDRHPRPQTDIPAGEGGGGTRCRRRRPHDGPHQGMQRLGSMRT